MSFTSSNLLSRSLLHSILLSLLWASPQLAAQIHDDSWKDLLSPFGPTSLSGSPRDPVEHYWRPPHKMNERPVVGIITLPITVPHQRKYGKSSFATSYIRWVEAGGARVVPIFYDSSKEELDYILNRINGVFWTGGLVDFNPEEDDPEGGKYLETTQYIFEFVKAQNENGKYYPHWGTCLGFERMFQLHADDENATLIEEVDAENFGINLGFTRDGWLSRLFGGMSYELFKEVASPVGDLAFNNHGLGVHPLDFISSKANSTFRILSIDADRNGKPFVSTIEGRRYPYYGTQWHPEKGPWEWNAAHEINHNEPSLTFSNYMGRFFVNECKYNNNTFENEEALLPRLVGNFPSVLTGSHHRIKSAYSEITFFKSHTPPPPFSLPLADEKEAAHGHSETGNSGASGGVKSLLGRAGRKSRKAASF